MSDKTMAQGHTQGRNFAVSISAETQPPRLIWEAVPVGEGRLTYQEAQRACAAWNACEGITTENLQHIKFLRTDDSIEAERDALRADNERLREALQACLTRVECEWPDERDGRGASPRNPGLIRDTKEQARAALGGSK